MLKHCAALKFVNNNREKMGVISKENQLRLFENTYQKYILIAQSYYRRRVKNKNKVRWKDLDVKIKKVFIDVQFQGLMRLGFAEACSNNKKGKL